MAWTLSDAAVREVLDRLRALSAVEDPAAHERVYERESQLGARVYGDERVALQRGAPLAIVPEVGELLYAMTLARRPRIAVEFGASLGFSTVHIAAALRDLGGGALITTEVCADKARALTANLVDAGLSDVVEVRRGDATQTLLALTDSVDLLFLDGANDLYLDVLRLVEPLLGQGALVIADMSEDDPHHHSYREHVRDPRNGFATVEIPLDAGVVISVRSSRFEAAPDG
jgi:predicted O-methyltransferase YrrM